MKFDQMLNRELKEMPINKIDIASKVIGELKSKKRYNSKKYIFVAVMLFMTVTTAFALDWITFNDDGSYTISSENKKWEQQFSMESNAYDYKKYKEIHDDLDKKSNELGVDLFGYYSSDEFEHPIYLWSNDHVFYDDFNLFNEETNHKWIDAVKNSISEDYKFICSIVRYAYPDQYLLERCEYAKEHARDGELYYKEIISEKYVYSMQLHYYFKDISLIATIVTNSSYIGISNHHIDSEVIEINGVPAVYSILSDNLKIIELVYDGNLLSVYGNTKTKEILIEIMSKILNNYNRQNIN